MSRIQWAYLGLAAAALFWAGNAIVARAVVDLIPPITLVFWRWVIAFLVLSPFALGAVIRDRRLLLARWPKLLVLAALSVGSFNAFLYIAAQTTTAINITLFNATVPMLVVALAWLLQGQRPRLLGMVGIVLGFAGILAIVSGGEWRRVVGLSLNGGDLWMLAAVGVWGLYSVQLRQYGAGLHALSLLWALILLGLPMLLPFYVWELWSSGPLEWQPPILWAFLFVGIFPSLLAYLFWAHGVRQAGPSRASLFIYLIPVFTTVVAVPVLGEQLLWHHLGGGLLILAGLWLASRR
ncbi:DMT family transporter [Alkalilimnicola sp. S0819]|uniref:DMT family transporter n=1 Tax=Alkalilimnicola sp. S0819 TaxID=2613922 RepID=UPI001869EC27|nr:DMT family transporter [Alkalilimnicola sp. S0819]